MLDSLGVPAEARGDSAGIGRLVRHDTTVAWSTYAAVRAQGHTLGHIVQWRSISLSAKGRKAIEDFVGSNAEVYIGNPDGSVWVDMAGSHADPPDAKMRKGGTFTFERRGHGTQVASIQTIAGTPWLIETDFPQASILAPANTFLRRIALVAVALLLAATLIARTAARRMARPLAELSEVAESIAGGDFNHPVARTDRGDEIGTLARAFRVMVEKVQATQQGLEDQVAERTSELRTAVSTLRDTQDELVRKERLALLGQLSSSVGHELRNPLGVMSNAVYYLDAVLPDAPETVREYLGILRAQIGMSEKIVADLLDFARIRQPDRQPIPLERIIASEVQSQHPPVNVQIRSELSPDVPVIYADPVHVGQILRNLTSNAIQAMEDQGGTLTVRSMHDGPGNVRIEVADTGIGIAPENLDKVFEPLFTTKARGIGLGLAVSRSLAIVNGGTLTVASTPGAGATFVLTLPAPDRGKA